MDPATFLTCFRGLGIFQINVIKKYGSLSVVQRHGYFAQQDYALIAILRDDNENVKVVKMLERWKQVVEESANNDDCPLALNSSWICLFDVPTLNLETNA